MERFCVATEQLDVATEYFYVATKLAKARRNYVMTKQFYVAIKLARVGRISVTTELATIESSATHNRVGRAKVGTHDSVVPCRVVTWHSRVVTKLSRQGLGT